ncbi:MAG: LrgB family protein [Clostridium sp.]
MSTLSHILVYNDLFGIVISLIAYEIGILLYRKTNLPIFNPLLIAIILVIGFLLIFHISFKTYNEGAQFINLFLAPSTVVLAVPLYKQIDRLKENLVPIIVGIICGSGGGIISIFLLSHFIGLDKQMIASLMAKSVTTPIAISVTAELHGLIPVTVLAVITTGIIGAVIHPIIAKVFKIKNKIAVGLSLGTSSHAIGTTKALEIGETEGAMSSLAIGVNGIITVILAPIIFSIGMAIFAMI